LYTALLALASIIAAAPSLIAASCISSAIDSLALFMFSMQ
jgi:hypothetical protein